MNKLYDFVGVIDKAIANCDRQILVLAAKKEMLQEIKKMTEEERLVVYQKPLPKIAPVKTEEEIKEE